MNNEYYKVTIHMDTNGNTILYRVDWMTADGQYIVSKKSLKTVIFEALFSHVKSISETVKGIVANGK